MWIFPSSVPILIPVSVAKAEDRGPTDKLTQALHRAADLADPKIRRRFREAADKLTDYDEQALIAALERGDINRALFILNIAEFPTLLLTVSPEITALAIRGVEITLANLAARKVKVDIFRVNPRVVEWARRYSSNLVVEIGEATREALREAIADGLQAGNNPRVIARQLRSLIGLNSARAKAVQNYRAKLEAAGEKGIERKVERFAAKQLRARAETIARTEVINSVSVARGIAMEAAYDTGQLPRSAKRKWVPAKNACTKVCAPMRGQVVGMKEDFITGDGRRVKHPGAHVLCRCSERLVF